MAGPYYFLGVFPCCRREVFILRDFPNKRIGSYVCLADSFVLSCKIKLPSLRVMPFLILPIIVWCVLLIYTSTVAEYVETIAFSAFSTRRSKIPLYEEGASTIRKSSYRVCPSLVKGRE
ncbi:hypothetical protein M9H77_16719 [Catharanthus roseus]|uniref:Uncharacterized protein n=1 Tax=Catharanthus roseus TaxID=4058 RepID=A0ACC0B2K3_CATRO|nr:hypothetical protein M9H77_16719 [Catharanthus roseus]